MDDEDRGDTSSGIVNWGISDGADCGDSSAGVEYLRELLGLV